MQGNSPDEEHIDPHGECRHEIERLRAALTEIRDDDAGEKAYGFTDVGMAFDRVTRIARDALATK